jgi:excisionase family DNA binding protein
MTVSLASDTPRLADWITLPEAAELLGVSKQYVHKLVRNGRLNTLRSLGSRPIYIVREAEILEIQQDRLAGRHFADSANV